MRISNPGTSLLSQLVIDGDKDWGGHNITNFGTLDGDDVYTHIHDTWYHRRVRLDKKSSDETVNNSATLQNDDDLVMAISAGEIWFVEFYLFFTSGPTPDLKYAITAPTGATVRYGIPNTYWRYNANASQGIAAVTAGTGLDVGGRAGADLIFIVIRALVVNGANAGNIQLQWAQRTADASDTIVKQHSFFYAIRGW